MITSILIANRGEIACRIISTARAMGIRTIAIASTPDEKARHTNWLTRWSRSAAIVQPQATLIRIK